MAATARLSKEALVTTAMEIADAQGLEAVTVRRLAQEHGVTPMALYRHFRDKEDVLDALAARLFEQVEMPYQDDRPWDAQMADVFSAVVRALRPHPAVAALVVTRGLDSEPALTLAERALGLLANAGFPVEDAAQIAGQALCSLGALVVSEPGGGPAAPVDPEEREAAVRARRATLSALPPARYPHVVAAADVLADCPNGDAYYERGVHAIVGGMRHVRVP
ncbi:TetR/AcrR family transcriptional regulator [Streptomyces sp. NBC_01497]|uniref:TetR/AcrR family transcriptional regulator n=1 Tax=Streptomyces sp. NBC_01497 TaxID=2903885 RepID=UPI002E350BF1|nr:TetR family transcriptional regulator [Streptomyces sp. NBC_01497]